MTRPGWRAGFAPTPTPPAGGDTGGGGTVVTVGWGAAPYPPDQVVRPAPSAAIRAANTWSLQSTGGRAGDPFSLTYSGSAPELDVAASNESPAATTPSAMRWYRFTAASWTPTDPESGYEVDIADPPAYGAIGYVFALELVTGPAAPSSGLTILVGWMDADTSPGAGALIAAGYRWTADAAAGNDAGKAGEVVTASGNVLTSVPAQDGDRVVAIWTPVGARVGRVTAWAETASTGAPTSGLVESGTLTTPIPSNWRPVILVGCTTTTDNGPHEATIRINVSPFAFYKPEIAAP